jgi:hypothetical protein
MDTVNPVTAVSVTVALVTNVSVFAVLTTCNTPPAFTMLVFNFPVAELITLASVAAVVILSPLLVQVRCPRQAMRDIQELLQNKILAYHRAICAKRLGFLVKAPEALISILALS